MHRAFHFFMFFIVVLYCSYAYLYFFNTGLTVIKPLFWHLIVIGISMSLLVLNRPITVPVVSTNLGVWFWLFTCSTIICFFYSSQGQVEVQA